jgi:ribonuclease E
VGVLAAEEPATVAEEVEPQPAAEGAAAPEEEKPKKKTRRGTRGGRGRKKPQPAPDGAAETPVEAIAPEQPVEIEASENGASAEGEEPPRKRTRRGTRGGRSRRKPAQAGAEIVGEAEPTEPVAASGDPG